MTEIEPDAPVTAEQNAEIATLVDGKHHGPKIGRMLTQAVLWRTEGCLNQQTADRLIRTLRSAATTRVPEVGERVVMSWAGGDDHGEVVGPKRVDAVARGHFAEVAFVPVRMDKDGDVRDVDTRVLFALEPTS